MLSTTELLVEHIISGILSLLWILVLVFTFTGLDLSIFPVIKVFWALFAIVITAIAYPIGIFIDALADKMLDSWNNKIKAKNNLPDHFSMIMLINKMNDDNVRSYFTYNRFKLRVARSSFVNFSMIAVSGFLFLLIRGSELGIGASLKIGLTVLVVFGILSLASLFLWREIAVTTHRRSGVLWEGVE